MRKDFPILGRDYVVKLNNYNGTSQLHVQDSSFGDICT